MTNSQIVFVDSNVLIEALFIPDSPAALLIDLAEKRTVDLLTCEQVVQDVENAILNKLAHRLNDADEVIELWHQMKTATRLNILTMPARKIIDQVFTKYMGVMRHQADIPVLAAALNHKPLPRAILSGNREHFNDDVSARCGIWICSCAEFHASAHAYGFSLN